MNGASIKMNTVLDGIIMEIGWNFLSEVSLCYLVETSHSSGARFKLKNTSRDTSQIDSELSSLLKLKKLIFLKFFNYTLSPRE